LKKITVCAKVPVEMAKKIQQTGFNTSDVIQAGLHMFLSLNPDQQVNQIFKQIQRKRKERVALRYGKTGHEEEISGP